MHRPNISYSFPIRQNEKKIPLSIKQGSMRKANSNLHNKWGNVKLFCITEDKKRFA